MSLDWYNSHTAISYILSWYLFSLICQKLAIYVQFACFMWSVINGWKNFQKQFSWKTISHLHSPDYILCGKYEFGCKWKMSKNDFRGDKIRGGFTQFPWNGCLVLVGTRFSWIVAIFDHFDPKILGWVLNYTHVLCTL